MGGLEKRGISGGEFQSERDSWQVSGETASDFCLLFSFVAVLQRPSLLHFFCPFQDILSSLISGKVSKDTKVTLERPSTFLYSSPFSTFLYISCMTWLYADQSDSLCWLTLPYCVDLSNPFAQLWIFRLGPWKAFESSFWGLWKDGQLVRK